MFLTNMNKFVVVKFPNKNPMAIIPDNWLVDLDTCRWPPRSAPYDSCLRRLKPQDDWETHKILIMKYKGLLITNINSSRYVTFILTISFLLIKTLTKKQRLQSGSTLMVRTLIVPLHQPIVKAEKDELSLHLML